jgi:hypothetical protein
MKRSHLSTPHRIAQSAGLRDILGASLKRSLASRLACQNPSAASASASAARCIVSGPTEGAANAHVLRVFDRPTANVQQAKTNPSPCHRVNAVSQCLYSTFYFLAVVRRIRSSATRLSDRSSAVGCRGRTCHVSDALPLTPAQVPVQETLLAASYSASLTVSQ